MDRRFVCGIALAALCAAAGCGVSEKRVNEIVAAKMAETRKYVDDKVGGFDQKLAKTEQNIAAMEAAVRADLTAANMKTEGVLKAVVSTEKQDRQDRESLRVSLEAQSAALEQQKRAVDAAIERMKSSAASSAPAPVKP